MKISKTDHFVGDYRLAPNSGRVNGVDSIPGMRFYGCLRKSVTSWLNARAAVTKVIDNGAILHKNSRSSSEWKVINSKQKPHLFRKIAETCTILKGTLSSFAPRKVYIVVAPCSTRLMELFDGRDELERYMKELDNLSNVSVINMFGDDRFTDADFVDTTHLNIKGAYKFTSFLKVRLKDDNDDK